MFSYGITQCGDYHVKNNTVCQDAHFIKKINDNFIIGAVADGLGSEKHSDVASKKASEISVNYCAQNISESYDENTILSIIKQSFGVALQSINSKAKEEGDDIDEYDTTLALAVFINDTVYYGHSGDSGIVTLDINGQYEALTEQQRDEYGYVFPLCSGEDVWVFGSKQNVTSVLLATDGMLDIFFPSLLVFEENPIYVALVKRFMDNEVLCFEGRGEDMVVAMMDKYVASIPADQVSDDKTVVLLLNPKLKPTRQPDTYYQVPDWNALKEKRDEAYQRMAYPHLFKDDNSNTESSANKAPGEEKNIEHPKIDSTDLANATEKSVVSKNETKTKNQPSSKEKSESVFVTLSNRWKPKGTKTKKQITDFPCMREVVTTVVTTERWYKTDRGVKKVISEQKSIEEKTNREET